MFSVLGFMATEQGVDISKVAESGKNTAHQGSSLRGLGGLYVVESEHILPTARQTDKGYACTQVEVGELLIEVYPPAHDIIGTLRFTP